MCMKVTCESRNDKLLAKYDGPRTHHTYHAGTSGKVEAVRIFLPVFTYHFQLVFERFRVQGFTMIAYMVMFPILLFAAQQVEANFKTENATFSHFAGNTIRQNSSRQYTGSQNNEVFVEQVYKPNVGYPYPSSIQSQKLTFTHDNTLHIYLFQNKLSLYCATDTTYEKITWTRFACPGQIGTQTGETIAVGPTVSNAHLYGVNSFGRNEEYVSELLIKQPLIPATDGAYVCEAVFISDKYPYEATTTIQDIMIIGGKGMYQNCYNSVAKVASRRSSNLTRFGF